MSNKQLNNDQFSIIFLKRFMFYSINIFFMKTFKLVRKFQFYV